jgi:hypothetical protein
LRDGDTESALREYREGIQKSLTRKFLVPGKSVIDFLKLPLRRRRRRFADTTYPIHRGGAAIAIAAARRCITVLRILPGSVANPLPSVAAR